MMPIKSVAAGIGLIIKKGKEVRMVKGMFEKPGTCEFECPYCGALVFSNYFELDRVQHGELAEYLHGGFLCSGCCRSLRV